MEGMKLIRVSKVTSNDSWPLIYLPKKVVEKLGFKKGCYVALYTDGKRLIIEKLELERKEAMMSDSKEPSD